MLSFFGPILLIFGCGKLQSEYWDKKYLASNCCCWVADNCCKLLLICCSWKIFLIKKKSWISFQPIVAAGRRWDWLPQTQRATAGRLTGWPCPSWKRCFSIWNIYKVALFNCTGHIESWDHVKNSKHNHFAWVHFFQAVKIGWFGFCQKYHSCGSRISCFVGK